MEFTQLQNCGQIVGTFHISLIYFELFVFHCEKLYNSSFSQYIKFTFLHWSWNLLTETIQYELTEKYNNPFCSVTTYQSPCVQTF